MELHGRRLTRDCDNLRLTSRELDEKQAVEAYRARMDREAIEGRAEAREAELTEDFAEREARFLHILSARTAQAEALTHADQVMRE